MIYQAICEHGYSGYDERKSKKLSDLNLIEGFNMQYTPPDSGIYIEPRVYFNIDILNKTLLIGKLMYQNDKVGPEKLSHYYLFDDDEREAILENNTIFGINDFVKNRDEADFVDVESQNILFENTFNANDTNSVKEFLDSLNIDRDKLKKIIFTCFQVAASKDRKTFFMYSSYDDETTNNNLNLLNIIFTILPPVLREQLGFITYNKYIQEVPSKNIKLIFTEKNEENNTKISEVIEAQNYIFDFTENDFLSLNDISYSSNFLDYLVAPFFGSLDSEKEIKISDVQDMLSYLISQILNPYKIESCDFIAAIYYLNCKADKSIDYEMGTCFLQNSDNLGGDLLEVFKDWVILNKGFENFDVDKNAINQTMFRLYEIGFKKYVSNFFTKNIENLLAENNFPRELVETVNAKLFGEEHLHENARQLLENDLYALDGTTVNSLIDKINCLLFYSKYTTKLYDFLPKNLYKHFENSKELEVEDYEKLLEELNSFSENLSDKQHETADIIERLHLGIVRRYTAEWCYNRESNNPEKEPYDFKTIEDSFKLLFVAYRYKEKSADSKQFFRNIFKLIFDAIINVNIDQRKTMPNKEQLKILYMYIKEHGYDVISEYQLKDIRTLLSFHKYMSLKNEKNCKELFTLFKKNEALGVDNKSLIKDCKKWLLDENSDIPHDKSLYKLAIYILDDKFPLILNDENLSLDEDLSEFKAFIEAAEEHLDSLPDSEDKISKINAFKKLINDETMKSKKRLEKATEEDFAESDEADEADDIDDIEYIEDDDTWVRDDNFDDRDFKSHVKDFIIYLAIYLTIGVFAGLFIKFLNINLAVDSISSTYWYNIIVIAILNITIYIIHYLKSGRLAVSKKLIFFFSISFILFTANSYVLFDEKNESENIIVQNYKSLYSIRSEIPDIDLSYETEVENEDSVIEPEIIELLENQKIILTIRTENLSGYDLDVEMNGEPKELTEDGKLEISYNELEKSLNEISVIAVDRNNSENKSTRIIHVIKSDLE